MCIPIAASSLWPKPFRTRNGQYTNPEAEIARPTDLYAVTGSGALRKVCAIFKHAYRGGLVVIHPYHLPALRCTPDHRVYATVDVNHPPQPIEAGHLTTHHYLVIPRRYADQEHLVDVTSALEGHEVAYGVPWKPTTEEGEPIAIGSAQSQARRETANGVSGHKVNRMPHGYTIGSDKHWPSRCGAIATDDYYLIPIRSLVTIDYDGDVYNMEVDEEHSFLANFFAVKNCQNWLTSQTLRDHTAGVEPTAVTPQQLVQVAKRYSAQLIGSSYNEPLITSEWAAAIFQEAKAAGLRTCYISNGNATPEVLRYVKPWTDCYKIDLKAFNDKNYRFLGGTLESVTNSITMVYKMGFWIEVVTLVIPGYNDRDDELRAAGAFIASVSPFIPWHVTAFHKDYKMTDPDNTSPETLLRAARIGEAAGLKYVYAGNLPGRVGKYEHTFCHHCQALLVERFGYHILQNRLTLNRGHCPECGTAIPGIWS